MLAGLWRTGSIALTSVIWRSTRIIRARGLGRGIVAKLVELSQGHKKIILYANPGKEGFYQKLGFRKMNTAMAIFENQGWAVQAGLVNETTVNCCLL